MAVGMGVEIERKFLVSGDQWRQQATEGRSLRQGYLGVEADATIRVRTDGFAAWLTIKGKADGLRRAEFEYAIPAADAGVLVALCGRRIVEKTRYRIPRGAHVWEVDEFGGRNAGLVTAEIELSSPDDEFLRPEWLGAEVSNDPRYSNANLAVEPFQEW